MSVTVPRASWVLLATALACGEPPGPQPRDSLPVIPPVTPPASPQARTCVPTGSNPVTATVGSEIALTGTAFDGTQVVQGAVVRFTVAPFTGLSGDFNVGSVTPDSAVSDAQGMVTARYRVGTHASTFSVLCAAAPATGPAAPTWRVTARAAPAARVSTDAESLVVMVPGATRTIPSPFVDSYGNRTYVSQWISADTILVSVAPSADSLSARAIARRSGTVVMEAVSGSLRLQMKATVLPTSNTPRIELDTSAAAVSIGALARAGSRLLAVGRPPSGGPIPVWERTSAGWEARTSVTIPSASAQPPGAPYSVYVLSGTLAGRAYLILSLAPGVNSALTAVAFLEELPDGRWTPSIPESLTGFLAVGGGGDGRDLLFGQSGFRTRTASGWSAPVVAGSGAFVVGWLAGSAADNVHLSASTKAPGIGDAPPTIGSVWHWDGTNARPVQLPSPAADTYDRHLLLFESARDGMAYGIMQDWRGSLALTGTVHVKTPLRFQLVGLRGTTVRVLRDLPLEADAQVLLDANGAPLVVTSSALYRSMGGGWLEIALPDGWLAASYAQSSTGVRQRAAFASDGTAWIPVRTPSFPNRFALAHVILP